MSTKYLQHQNFKVLNTLPSLRISRRIWVKCAAGKRKTTIVEKVNNLEAPVLNSITDGPSTSSQTAYSVKALTSSSNSDLFIKIVWKRLLKELSSLPRAIAIMFSVAVLSGLGTFIPQNKGLEFYMEKYPDVGEKVLGFLSYQWIVNLQLDHIYTAWYFYGLLGLLGASLMACTATRQWPAAKVAQRWRFVSEPGQLARLGEHVAEVLPSAKLGDLGDRLSGEGYQVFLKDSSLYAFKGLAGKLGPIGVHAALLLSLAGTGYSGWGGLKGSVMCPEKQEFYVESFLHPASLIASPPEAAKNMVAVNGFSIDYRPDGSVAQFYSDLSLLDPVSHKELKRETISVNKPFRYGGVTMYQTDWSLASVNLRLLNVATDNPELANGVPLNLPMASLEGQPGINGRLWAAFLVLGPPPSEGAVPPGISLLARDPQSVVLYDGKGKFVGVRRPGSNKPIEVEGLSIIIDQVVGATGLEIKSDPGVPLVYAGFGGLMITTLISYVSHSQVWATQSGSDVIVAGKTNRAKTSFKREMDILLESMPERV